MNNLILTDGTEYSDDSEEDEFDSDSFSSTENSDSDMLSSLVNQSSTAIDWISSTSNILKPNNNIKRFGKYHFFFFFIIIINK